MLHRTDRGYRKNCNAAATSPYQTTAIRDLVESGSLQIKRRFVSAITFFSP